MKNTFWLFVTFLWVAAGCQSAFATLIASQGFENEPTPSTTQKAYTGGAGPLVDQTLSNTVSTGIGGEVGFSGTNDGGISEGDEIGVKTVGQIISNSDINAPSDWPGALNDGSNNAYTLTDTDGTATVFFDAVDLTFVENAVVSLDFLAMANEWESSDQMHVKASTDLGDFFLLNITDGDTLDLGTAAITKGVWSNLSQAIPDAATWVVLEVSLSSSANDEMIVFDNYQVNGNIVPEPSTYITWGVMGLVGTGLYWKRRKK